MIKGIFTTIGLLIALPFYCLYLIGKGITSLLGVKASPKKTSPKVRSTRTKAKPKTKPKTTKQSQVTEFDIDELEKYDAIFDD